jgi:hypothetical protein
MCSSWSCLVAMTFRRGTFCLVVIHDHVADVGDVLTLNLDPEFPCGRHTVFRGGGYVCDTPFSREYLVRPEN